MDRNIWKDGIIGLVVGDALGLPAQFTTREEIKANPIKGMEGYGICCMPEGTWSDDSSMAIAILDSIRRCEDLDVKDIMNNFVKWLYKGEFTPYGEAFDIGLTCMEAIERYVVHRDLDTCGRVGERANGNGGLMRIMPVCLWTYECEKTGKYTEDDAMNAVHKLTAVTHNHLRAHMASGIYYFMVKAVLEYKGGIGEMAEANGESNEMIDHKSSLMKVLQIGIDNAMKYYGRYSENYYELGYYKRLFYLEKFALVEEDDIRSSGYVVDSIEAAVWSLITTDSYKECLLKAVNLGDDADTVGAIAGGLAGLYYGYESIPEEWLDEIVRREWIEEMCVV